MLGITESTQGEWLVLTATGRADVLALDQLDKAIANAVETNSQVALDLSGLEYMSSAGLRALISGARSAQKRNAKFVVCGPNASIRKIFEVSGVNKLLTIEDGLPC